MNNNRVSHVSKSISVLALSLFLCGPSLFAFADDSEKSDTAASAAPEGIVFKGGMPVVWPPSGDPRPYAESPYARQIDQGLAYLLHGKPPGDQWGRLLLLDFFRRKFGLHQRYALVTTYAPYLRGAYGEDSGNHAFKRLFDPQHTLTLEEIEAAQDVERPLLRALFCDKYPLADSFFDEISIIMESDVQFLHVLACIAYIMLRDNGCAAGDERVARLRDLAAARLRRLAMADIPNKGLKFNAVALLYGMGFSNLVEEDWIENIVGAQNEDGGWPSHKFADGDAGSEGAATAHALWALLEHALPDAPETAWVPRHESDETERGS